jgi:hypothetical protein
MKVKKDPETEPPAPVETVEEYREFVKHLREELERRCLGDKDD